MAAKLCLVLSIIVVLSLPTSASTQEQKLWPPPLAQLFPPSTQFVSKQLIDRDSRTDDRKCEATRNKDGYVHWGVIQGIDKHSYLCEFSTGTISKALPDGYWWGTRTDRYRGYSLDVSPDGKWLFLDAAVTDQSFEHFYWGAAPLL